ncbi:hypothetical protein ACFLX5_03900 [Chloroflexota bacterium]
MVTTKGQPNFPFDELSSVDGNVITHSEQEGKTPTERNAGRDYWSHCGQVFFHYGTAYGLTDRLKTVRLGSADDVQEALKTRIIPDVITGPARDILSQIIEAKGDTSNGTRRTELKKPGDFRSRSTRTVKRRITNLNQAKIRKKPTGYKA